MDYGQPQMVWNLSEQEKSEILAQRRKQEKARNLVVFLMGVGVLFLIMAAKMQYLSMGG